MKNAKKLTRFGIIAAAIVLALGAFVYALSLPPVVSISATPSSANMTSTIVAVATDLSHTGIGNVDIYENNTKVKSCNLATCVYVAVHSGPLNRTYYAIATDGTGRVGQSATISVHFQGVVNSSNSTNNAPILNPIGNRIVNVSQLLQFVISATDADGDSLNYSASGVPAGASFNAATRTFSWTPVIGDLGAHFVNFSVSDGFLLDSEVVRIDVVINGTIDSEAPRWSNLVENPANGTAYSPSQGYEFNVTWTDNAGIGAVWMEFNGVNYTVAGNAGVYSFKLPGLAAGTYNYAWHAVDTSGNVNATGIRSYVVSKALPVLSLNLLPSSSVANGTTTNVTGFGCPAQLTCALYRNGVNVSNSDIANLASGTYNYVYNTTGNENYSARSVSATLGVGTGSGDNGGTGGNGGGKTLNITDSELTKGVYVTMHIDDRLKFSFCGAPYYIKLTDVMPDDNKAYFKLTPGELTFTLKEGMKNEIDLNDDGINDILFRLETASSDKAKVYIKRISDVCGNIQPQQDEVITPAETIEPKQESSDTLLYISLFLMAGIFLAALAILIYLLSRMRNRKK